MGNWLEELRNEIEGTRKLLKENNEWENRYVKYAEEISANTEYISEVRKKFHEWAPLYLYLNFTNAKNAKRSVDFEVRYLGQTVAQLKYKGDLRLSTKGFDNKNKRDFHCQIKLSDIPWDSKQAREFRSFFKKSAGVRNTVSGKENEEHRLESLLLTEFSKKKDKALQFIKPVRIGDFRFPMATPISASNHKKIKYSGTHGGGIDMFARVGTGGRNTYLLIMELKAMNLKKEPPIDALRQGLAYTVFIRELLRSDAGPAWYKLFGFNSDIPEKLVLHTACVMPSNENNDKSFEGQEVKIDNDVIKLHYIYFTEKDNEIKDIDTSLNFKRKS